jgi:ferredoxin like protein
MTELQRSGLEPLDERLARVSFVRDSVPHMVLDEHTCASCPIDRVCVTVCPAGNFKHDEKAGTVSVSCESCMECGACRIACTENAIQWQWPRGGFGVCYLQG